jgi:hypothetical protein
MPHAFFIKGRTSLKVSGMDDWRGVEGTWLDTMATLGGHDGSGGTP